MGIVSHELHRNYIVLGSVRDCLVFGLFDSIGLSTIPSEKDLCRAGAWLDRICLAPQAHTPFHQLSFADQRLVPIARALKLPELLILDEPTQGLDRANRDAVLSFLGDVAGEGLSTILYVSPRRDENRPFFTRRIALEAFGDPDRDR